MKRPEIETQVNSRVGMRIALILLGLGGGLLVWVSTSRYGIGLSPDSVDYIMGARRLLASNGLRQAVWALPVEWPPLYSTLLAILWALGIDAFMGARLLSALSFGLITLATGSLVGYYTNSRFFALLGATSVLVSIPILSVSVMAWSEPLFIFLSILFVWQLSRFLTEPSMFLLILITGLTTLACLQRYIGVSLILTGSGLIIFAMQKAGLLRRVQYAIFFLIASALPVVVWLIRNYRLSHTLTGTRTAASSTLQTNLCLVLDVVTKFFLPTSISLEGRLLIGGFIFGLIFLKISQMRRKHEADGNRLNLLPVVVFPLVYTCLLLTSASLVKFDNISNRLLAPAYIFLLCLFLILLHRISQSYPLLERRFNRRVDVLLSFVLLVAFGIWLIYAIITVSTAVSNWHETGAGGYSSVVWRESSFTKWLESHTWEGQIFSNDPQAAYIFMNRDAIYIPWRSSALSVYRDDTFRTMWLANGKNYLVWFSLSKRTDFDPRFFASAMGTRIEPVVELPDGAVYVLVR